MKHIFPRNYLLYLLPFLFLLLILLFPAQARNGASNGLLLWFNVLLPTLLPFMILADLIRRLHIIDRLCNRISARTGKNLYFLYPLCLGLLTGLPLGAKLTADAVRSGQLSRQKGQFLLTVCNNSSTMFLMGYVAEVQLQRPELIKYFLLFIPLSSLLAALLQTTLSTFFYPFHNKAIPSSTNVLSTNTQASPLSVGTTSKRPPFISSVSSSIMDSFTTITLVGGFVILFSVLAEFALLINSPFTLHLVAALEMTTGVRAVCASSLSESAKTILSAATVSFTGLSGIAQTACVFSETGLFLMRYIFSRLLSAAFCIMLFYIFV